MTDLTLRFPQNFSYSQLSTYLECGEMYRLKKGYKLGMVDWWATAAGGALHTMTANLDLGIGVRASDFREHFEAEIAEREAEGTTWKASGRITKEVGWSGGPTKKDKDWWLEWGPRVFEAYVDWRERTAWEVVTVLTEDGPAPAVELEFEVEIGGRKVRGAIDRIFRVPGFGVAIVDLKTGKEPGGKLQLATYRLAASLAWGVQADWAGYLSPFMKDDLLNWACPMHSLTNWSAEYVDHLYRMADAGIKAGVFLPDTSHCNICDAAAFCRMKEGALADEIPLPTLAEIPSGPDTALNV